MQNLVISVLALTSFAVAQKTIVVDGSGKGQHKTIQAGVDAAKDGDRVVVRPGFYTPFVIDNKSLTLLADRGATIYGFFQTGRSAIRNTAANKHVVIDGLSLVGSSKAGLFVENCKGRVSLRSVLCSSATVPFGLPTPSALNVMNSSAVLLQDSSVPTGIEAMSSNLTIVSSTVRGLNSNAGHYFVAATHALRALNCALDIANSTLSGGVGAQNFPSRPALDVSKTRVVLRDSASLNGSPSAALAKNGSTLERGKGATVRGKLLGFSKQTTRALPSLTTTPAQQGQRYRVDAHGQSGDLYAIFVAAPATPLGLGAFGDLWLDPSTLVALGAGTIPTGGKSGVAILAGTDTKWFGLELDFQAIVGKATDVRLTNLAIVAYR